MNLRHSQRELLDKAGTKQSVTLIYVKLSLNDPAETGGKIRGLNCAADEWWLVDESQVAGAGIQKESRTDRHPGGKHHSKREGETQDQGGKGGGDKPYACNNIWQYSGMGVRKMS